MGFAAILYGPDILFSQEINPYVFVGVLAAAAEGVFRLRDGTFRVKPAEETAFPASVYGVPLKLFLQPIFAKVGLLRELPIPVDGFYGDGFVEKLERERRYGNVYSLQDWGESYYLQVEFPRRVPRMGPPINEKLPEEMPDYDYDLLLKNGT